MKYLLLVLIGLGYAIFASANCDGGHVQITLKNDKPYNVFINIDGEGQSYVAPTIIPAGQEQQFCLPLQVGGIYQLTLKSAHSDAAHTRKINMGLGIVNVLASSIITN